MDSDAVAIHSACVPTFFRTYIFTIGFDFFFCFFAFAVNVCACTLSGKVDVTSQDAFKFVLR